MISVPDSIPLGFEGLATLLAKYDVSGPRYTSYPTAPQFRTDWDAAALAQELERDNQAADAPLSLYVHLPFCEQRCWFCGCTTVITRNHKVTDAYLDDLQREMDLTAGLIDRRRPVVQAHFGGGTPTFLSPEELTRLGKMLKSRFAFSDRTEFSVEIDPRHLTPGHVEAFRAMGCNRASLGVQDFNPTVQQAIHRIQPREMTETAVRRLREAGFTSVNLDLIYGLPQQTRESFGKTLEQVLALAPDRLAVFSYAHVPSIKPAQRIFEQRGGLPAATEKLGMLALSVEKLSAAGYACVGMDHFARENDELAVAQREGSLHRNFQGYTTCADASLYSFGMSAISQTRRSYRQNHKGLADYSREIRAGRLPTERALLVNDDDLVRREIIQRIMCDGALSYGKLGAKLGLDFEATFAREIASLDEAEADGLVHRFDGGFTITPVGRLLVRTIAMRFDRYLGSGPRTFSRTV